MEKRGISLIEILVVLGLVGLISTMSFLNARVSRDSNTLKDAGATVLLSLERARSRAQTGYGTSPHGVRVSSDRIETFAGSDYATAVDKITILLPSAVSTDQTDTDIIFERLSAEPSFSTDITLTHQKGITSKITVDENGSIFIEE